MGLDLHELNIPLHRLGLYQAGVRHLLPEQEQNPGHKPRARPAEVNADLPATGGRHFPPPWSELWARLHPPYTMVWTYWQLPEDLGDHPDPERRQLFRTILAKLGWPRGSVAFWPLSSYAPGRGHSPRPDLFWIGVQSVEAQLVVVFGLQAFRTLFADQRASFGFTTTREGLQIVHVPGPEDMLPDNREMKNLAWNMLCPLVPGR